MTWLLVLIATGTGALLVTGEQAIYWLRLRRATRRHSRWERWMNG